MPQTPLGLTYPDDQGHTRLWEHFQTLATDVDPYETWGRYDSAAIGWEVAAGWSTDYAEGFRQGAWRIVSAQVTRTGANITLFLLPGGLLYIALVVNPLIQGFVLATYRWRTLSHTVFVGSQVAEATYAGRP